MLYLLDFFCEAYSLIVLNNRAPACEFSSFCTSFWLKLIQFIYGLQSKAREIMLFHKTQCTFHYLKLKSNHRVRFPSCMLNPTPPVVSNYTCVPTKHEAWVSLDIGHEFSLADCKAPLPSRYRRTFWLSYGGGLKVPPALSGSVHSFLCRMKPYIKRAWKVSFSVGLSSAWKLHGCLQSSGEMPTVSILIYNSYTIAPMHKQISSMCMQTGIGKRHCTALWVLGVSKGTGVQTPKGN